MNGTTLCKADLQAAAKDLRYLARLVFENEVSMDQFPHFLRQRFRDGLKLHVNALYWAIDFWKRFPGESYAFFERGLKGIAYFMEEPR